MTLDGGLPRHLILNVPNPATDVYEKHNAFDFTKELDSAIAVKLPEDGTAEEKVAMTYHEKGSHPTDLPDGGTGVFRTNGRPRLPGRLTPIPPEARTPKPGRSGKQSCIRPPTSSST